MFDVHWFCQIGFPPRAWELNAKSVIPLLQSLDFLIQPGKKPDHETVPAFSQGLPGSGLHAILDFPQFYLKFPKGGILPTVGNGQGKVLMGIV